MLDAARIASQLNSDRFTLSVVEQTGSTSTDLRRMALEGASEGAVRIADTQTAGRGRRGRQFHSPHGGLYLSFLLRPETAADPGLITCRVAVAVAQAIESLCPLNVEIKWVNDLYINDRKVAGILAEGILSPSGAWTAVVVGVGVNVDACAFPEELAEIATSLGNEGATLSREDLAAAILNEWERMQTTADGAMMTLYRRRSLVLGRKVTVLRGLKSFDATGLAITDQGHLVVNTAYGEMTLTSGEVSLRL